MNVQRLTHFASLLRDLGATAAGVACSYPDLNRSGLAHLIRGS